MRVFVVLLLLSAAAAARSPALYGALQPAQRGRVVTLSAANADSLGARTVAGVCMACHTMQGPAGLAPPFAMIASRYRAASASPDEAAARMARYIRSPVADSSLLPPMAIERFGLMPALPLPDSVLLATARHVVEAGGAMGGGRHQHRR